VTFNTVIQPSIIFNIAFEKAVLVLYKEMKRIVSIFILLFAPFVQKAQVAFNTVVSQQPVVVGESFQVQYIISETGKIGNFKALPFKYFRFISGPNQYNGSVNSINANIPVINFVFTLEAIKPGRFIIPGAMATVNGKPVQSDNVYVEVISKQEAKKRFERNGGVNADYFLRPGEDPYEKIRQNLFLKLVIDKTSCFAGEPVLAIFKLYSRLESNSDIVKNPGFYGFTVYDVVNLSDKQVNTEIVNGKLFDVHTIRKIQLYPLQAGNYTIDAMEVMNKVEFSRSTINKKTEQEIAEGILGYNNEEAKQENTEVFETSMHTEPVMIHVKPTPLQYKPTAFNGAVGNFAISALVVKGRGASNEENFFEISINGKGNFTQLNAPQIIWPGGIEGFEPIVIDSLDKLKLPLTGSKIFRYPFVCNNPGLYQLPIVNFSFFDPGTNSYKTVSTSATQVEISNERKKHTQKAERKESIADKNAKASKVAGGIVILLVIFVLTYWILRKDKSTPAVMQELKYQPSVDESLMPLDNVTNVSDKEFCTKLHQILWEYLGNRQSLEGSGLNKENLFSKLELEGVKDEIVTNLQRLLTECEMGMFTDAALEINKEKLLTEAKEVLEAIHNSVL
jgi:hypothetical protein